MDIVVSVVKNSGREVISKNNISKNICYLIDSNSISKYELANTLGVPYNTIHRLCTGETADPKISTLQLIADYFGIGLDSLIHNDNSQFKDASPYSNRPQSIPIFTWEVLSDGCLMKEVLTTNNWDKWETLALVETLNLSKFSFAVESKKSMQPRFPQGTIFIVDQEEKPIDGDLVLIRMKNDNAVSLKELVIDPPYWQLLPLVGGEVPTITLDNNKHEIVGTVVLSILKAR